MKNDIVTGKCVDMSIDGLGIAKANDLVIFVKGLIKGEVAGIRITKEKSSYAYGIIDKLIEVSPHRKQLDCPVAYKCGGCDLRHIDYKYQLVLKKEILENILKPFKVENITEDDNPYYYRNKIQIPCRDSKMGFYRKYSNDIIEFDDCLLESKIANNIIYDLKKIIKDNPYYDSIRHFIIKHGKQSNEVMFAIVSNDFNKDYKEIVDYLIDKYPNIKSIILNHNDKKTNVILGDEERVLYGRDYIIDIFEGIKVKIALKSFYQINHDMMIKLYNKVLQLAELDNDTRVLDLYCGIGTISLFLSRHCKEVTGIEIVKEAIDNAKENALMNNITNAEFVLADASKGMDEYLKDKDVLILDPPRKGISKELIDSIKKSDIKKIVYVSCNPVTLARDLKLLQDHFDIGIIYPFDMFGYTTHVENVVCLNRF